MEPWKGAKLRSSEKHGNWESRQVITVGKSWRSEKGKTCHDLQASDSSQSGWWR